MDYSLHILGCRGSLCISGKGYTEFGGQTTCSVIKAGKHAVIVDCGTGLYNARELLSNCATIDVILTHMHYDHCLGLLDYSVFPDSAKLNFYGNFGKWGGKKVLDKLFSNPFWPVNPINGTITQIPPFGKKLELSDNIVATFYPSNHPNNSTMVCLEIGKKKIVIMVDCETSDSMPEEITNDCDILMYDGMYDDKEYELRKGWGHSTWQEGCKFAAKSNAKQLIISHHSPYRKDSELIKMETLAKKMFKNTAFARPNMTIDLTQI